MTGWLHPETYVEELSPWPVPICVDDPAWKYVGISGLPRRSVDRRRR